MRKHYPYITPEADEPTSLTISDRTDAFRTLRDAARGGHWLYATVALYVDGERRKPTIPGEGWRASLLHSKDDVVETYRVVGFGAEGALVAGSFGALKTVDDLCGDDTVAEVWHVDDEDLEAVQRALRSEFE